MNIWQRLLLVAASVTLVGMLLIPPTILATLGGLHVTQGYRSLLVITQPESKLTIDTRLFYAQFLTVLAVTALLWVALRTEESRTSSQDRMVDSKPAKRQESAEQDRLVDKKPAKRQDSVEQDRPVDKKPAKRQDSVEHRQPVDKPARRQDSADSDDEFMKAKRRALKEARRKLGLDR